MDKLNEIADAFSSWIKPKKKKLPDDEEKEASTAKKVEKAFNDKLGIDKDDK